MPVHKQKRARNIKGMQLRTLATEALKMPREPRVSLAKRLLGDIHWGGPAPAVEVLEKKITEIRKKSAGYSDKDKPWSVVTIANREYELPPDTLPLVMKMGEYFRQREGRAMSIREALWAGRLSALSNKVSFKDYAAYVIDYAALEKVNETLGRDEVDERVTDSGVYRDMTGLGPDEKVENEKDRHPKGEGVRWEEGEDLRSTPPDNPA